MDKQIRSDFTYRRTTGAVEVLNIRYDEEYLSPYYAATKEKDRSKAWIIFNEVGFSAQPGQTPNIVALVDDLKILLARGVIFDTEATESVHLYYPGCNVVFNY